MPASLLQRCNTEMFLLKFVSLFILTDVRRLVDRRMQKGMQRRASAEDFETRKTTPRLSFFPFIKKVRNRIWFAFEVINQKCVSNLPRSFFESCSVLTHEVCPHISVRVPRLAQSTRPIDTLLSLKRRSLETACARCTLYKSARF